MTFAPSASDHIETPAPAMTFDWSALEDSLARYGNAVLPQLLTEEQCKQLITLYDDPNLFRSRVIMSRHGFGRGEYQYFAYPLPTLIETLRQTLYPPLALIANTWHAHMKRQTRFPRRLNEYLASCHAAGQTRPTPLMLKYGAGDYNCLHQDLYGELCFPLQVVILLSRPDEDFTGGEFVMTEAGAKHPRADVIQLRQGDALILTVNQRPGVAAEGQSRGARKTAMRHGVSKLHSGNRMTIGLIFHDAQ